MRQSRLNPISPDRQRKRETVDAFGDLTVFVMQEDEGGCLVQELSEHPEGPANCVFHVDPCHLDARGMGGGKGDWAYEPERMSNPPPGYEGTEVNELTVCEDGVWRWVAHRLMWQPVRGIVARLCRFHHREYDEELVTNEAFLERHGFDIEDWARQAGLQFMEGR